MESFILCIYPYQCLPKTLVLTQNTGLVIPTAATRWHVLEKPNLLSIRQIPPLAAVVRCASKVARWRSTRTWGGTSVLKSQLPSVTAKGTAPEDAPTAGCYHVPSGAVRSQENQVSLCVTCTQEFQQSWVGGIPSWDQMFQLILFLLSSPRFGF